MSKVKDNPEFEAYVRSQPEALPRCAKGSSPHNPGGRAHRR
jgi:hypothetical protein